MKTSPKVTLKMKTTPKTKNMKTYLDCICNFSPDYHRIIKTQDLHDSTAGVGVSYPSKLMAVRSVDKNFLVVVVRFLEA